MHVDDQLPEYLCHCLKVTVDDIRRVAESNSGDNVDDLYQQTSAGAGCTACKRRIRAILELHQGEQHVGSQDSSTRAFRPAA